MPASHRYGRGRGRSKAKRELSRSERFRASWSRLKSRVSWQPTYNQFAVLTVAGSVLFYCFLVFCTQAISKKVAPMLWSKETKQAVAQNQTVRKGLGIPANKNYKSIVAVRLTLRGKVKSTDVWAMELADFGSYSDHAQEVFTATSYGTYKELSKEYEKFEKEGFLDNSSLNAMRKNFEGDTYLRHWKLRRGIAKIEIIFIPPLHDFVYSDVPSPTRWQCDLRDEIEWENDFDSRVSDAKDLSIADYFRSCLVWKQYYDKYEEDCKEHQRGDNILYGEECTRRDSYYAQYLEEARGFNSLAANECGSNLFFSFTWLGILGGIYVADAVVYNVLRSPYAERLAKMPRAKANS